MPHTVPNSPMNGAAEPVVASLQRRAEEIAAGHGGAATAGPGAGAAAGPGGR